jgi:hypothetical protein
MLATARLMKVEVRADRQLAGRAHPAALHRGMFAKLGDDDEEAPSAGQ